MDNNNIILTGLKNYYKTLRRTGHVIEIDTYRLLLAAFIADFCKKEYSWYYSDEDYDYLIKLLKCLSRQTCYIPYNPECIKTDPIENFVEDTPISITENEVIKFTMNDLIKLVNK
jgi:hypothetical protein